MFLAIWILAPNVWHLDMNNGFFRWPYSAQIMNLTGWPKSKVKLQLQMAVTLKICISDAMLVKLKWVWELTVFWKIINKQLKNVNKLSQSHKQRSACAMSAFEVSYFACYLLCGALCLYHFHQTPMLYFSMSCKLIKALEVWWFAKVTLNDFMQNL